MWFLGLYVGDGFIKKHKNSDKKSVEIAIPESQEELRGKLKKVVENLFGYEITSSDKDRIRIYSTIIAEFLLISGFGGNAHTKRIPNWVFSLPQEQMLSFLAGYIDSDGQVSKDNRVVLKSCNKELIDDFRSLAIYCNIHPSNIFYLGLHKILF